MVTNAKPTTPLHILTTLNYTYRTEWTNLTNLNYLKMLFETRQNTMTLRKTKDISQ